MDEGTYLLFQLLLALWQAWNAFTNGGWDISN